MTLMDRIIDEAEQLADRFPDLDDDGIIEHLSETCNVKLHPNSQGAKLGIAAYDRWNVTKIVL